MSNNSIDQTSDFTELVKKHSNHVSELRPLSEVYQEYRELIAEKHYWSIDLQNPALQKQLMNDGYIWIRRNITRPYDYIIRNPTIGCFIETFKTKHSGCILLESKEGQKMIKKICYF